MNILEINPYIRYASPSAIPPPFRINRRIIFDYELLYIEDGSFILTYNDNEILCQKDDLLLICPNIPHSFHILKTTLSQPHIHFDMKYDFHSEKVYISYQDYCDLSAAERKMIRENIFPQLKASPFIKINDRKTFLKIFYRIVYSKEKNSLHCKSDMLCLIQMILEDNPSAVTTQPASSPRIAMLLKSYIDSNYQQEISLDVLERQFDYSKFYIEKLFKQEYGISVINYRNTKRMEVAVRLLKEHSVSKTAQLLGYSSIYVFSRAFRQMYGVSPTKYADYEIETI